MSESSSSLPKKIQKLFNQICNDSIEKTNYYSLGSEYLKCDSILSVLSQNRDMSNHVVNAYLQLLQTTLKGISSKVLVFGTWGWEYVIKEYDQPDVNFIER
jgi:hypothetical protein